MADGSIAVPVLTPTDGVKETDCETLVRDGVTYYRQRVSVESLPGLANDSAADTVGTLNKILKELRLMNLHLAAMTGETFTNEDI